MMTQSFGLQSRKKLVIDQNLILSATQNCPD